MPGPKRKKTPASKSRNTRSSVAAAGHEIANVDLQRNGPTQESAIIPQAMPAPPNAHGDLEVAVTHSYGTRSTNRGRHPANEAGLGKRTFADIQADAAAKKAITDDVRAKKLAADDAHARKVSQKKDIVALLQQQKAVEDGREAHSFNTAPPPGDSDSPHDADRNDGTVLDLDGLAPLPCSAPRFSDDESSDNSELNASPFAQRNAPSKRGIEYAGAGSDGGQTQSTPDRARILLRPATVSTRKRNTEPVIELSDGEEGTGSRAAVQGDPSPDGGEVSGRDKPNKSLKLTAAQKKAEKRREIRQDLDSRTHLATLPLEPSASGRQGAKQSQKANRKAATSASPAPSTPAQGSAFSLSWRRRLHEGSQSSPSLASASRGFSVSPAPRSNAAAKLLVKQRAVPVEDLPDDEFIGGLSEHDVHAERRAVLSAAQGAQKQGHLHFVEVSAESGDATSEGKKRKKSASMASLRSKPKKKVKPSAELESDEESLSEAERRASIAWKALPDWAKPDVKTKVVPTIVEFLAIQDDPWSLDTQGMTFQELAQEVINAVFPERHHKLEKSDNIYKWCQQQVYEWHRAFQKAANAVVRDEKVARHSSTRLSDYDRSEQGFHDWLQQALEKGGAAMWGKPNTVNPDNARESLQSKYILRVMTVHLSRTIGSVQDAPSDAYPIGALALAAAAVQRAFEWYLNDQPRGLKQAKFSLKTAGALTGVWREGAVSDLCEKPHRFDRLLQRAAASVVAPVAEAKPCRSKDKAVSMYMRERSSSPVQAGFVEYEHV